ncbi:FtsK/SpoIIIE domain-containing protein (plasmid) [Paraclostridium ghonii]|uniref:FtsK/SpoIIIE domain-containing protein n=1 Tax=Paraclostridium ghonii TaxID=29358 RepID=UPI00202CC99A|nr:FtsK/SpoIIIE domain-containing protein [Paeniclostridium ghonii]MCM0166547.1 hypothetical protein [Paeniclostridium ghonii]
MSDKNALEPLADGLVEGINLLGTVAIQASVNVIALSSKGISELIKLVVDVTNIGYQCATGTYDYEVATTDEAEKTKLKSITDIEYKKIDYEYKPIQTKYLELSSFDCGLKEFVKFKRNNEVEDNSLKCFIGENENGKTQELDLFKDGSLLIGGASRFGKTSLIYSILLSFMDRYDPNYLRMVLVDFKEVDLVRLDKYKHIISNCITDVNKLNNLLTWCENECKNRAEKFRENDVSNIQDFNKISEIKMQPIIVVIDEIAQVLIGDKKQTDKIKDRIFKLVSKSMCFGVYWIVCTQELSRETLGRMKINFTQSIGLKCADKIASDMIIKDGNLEDIKIKGRAKIENSEGITEFQSYWTTKEDFERILKNKRKGSD